MLGKNALWNIMLYPSTGPWNGWKVIEACYLNLYLTLSKAYLINDTHKEWIKCLSKKFALSVVKRCNIPMKLTINNLFITQTMFVLTFSKN